MGAALAIVAVIGGLLSLAIVKPAGIITSCLTVSLGGSAVTLAVAVLSEWRRSLDQSSHATSEPADAADEPVTRVPAETA